MIGQTFDMVPSKQQIDWGYFTFPTSSLSTVLAGAFFQGL